MLIQNPDFTPHIWDVGVLCRAVADALQARFNPVAVRGEISGFARAASGHCYFTLKDAQGQIRCAMFRRAAQALDFTPRDGELVQVQGRLGVYEPRGDLQLVVEQLQRAGQGALYEQFVRLKARLEADGLFDAERKRALPAMPRCIGLVTSLGAAALHDVVTALARRVPHIPVVLAPAQVQGAGAAGSMCAALAALYTQAHAAATPIDVILLVRGGGSLEDLWAFNDEALARTIVQSPVPVVSGVGHETDFTIADFCADLRAPTPTAAAELAALPRAQWQQGLQHLATRLHDGLQRHMDSGGQRLDQMAARLGRPSALVQGQQQRQARLAERLRHGLLLKLQLLAHNQKALEANFPLKIERALQQRTERLDRLGLRLDLLSPQRVLERGYAIVGDAAGRPLTSVHQAQEGAALRATLADGHLDLRVQEVVAVGS